MNFSILKRSFSVNTSKPQHKPHQDLEVDEPPFPVLRGKELYINKNLSRDSSTGQSSRIYYNSTTNLGVPFQWEKKPGTPMNPPPEIILQQTPTRPLLPPAARSLVLPQPNVDMRDSSLSWRFWLWRRRLSKNMRLHMYDRRGYHMKFGSNAKGNKVSSVDGDLDAELVGWTQRYSKSSSSSSLSCSSGLLSNDQFDSFRKGVPFCCTTWRRHKWSYK